MPVIDRAHLGRRYGPYRYVVGTEEIRDFAVVLAGGVPGRVFAPPPPEDVHPFHLHEEAARASRHGALVAPPTFCVRFAMQPFTAACADPALGIDLPRLLHGEQVLELGAPVHPGDVLTTVGEISDLKTKPGLEIMAVRTVTENQRGQVAVVGLWTAVIRG